MSKSVDEYKVLLKSLSMKTGDKRHQTHFNFPGVYVNAKIHVPNEITLKNLYDSLYRVITLNLGSEHSPLVLAERIPKDGLFRLFFDWDGKLKETTNTNEIIATNLLVVSSVADLLTEAHPEVEHQISVASGCLHKLHIICPGIIVDKQSALSFCQKLQQKLVDAGCQLAMEWLDTSVYDGKGLRLLGCHKGNKHKKEDKVEYEVQFGSGSFQHSYAPVNYNCEKGVFEKRVIERKDLDEYSIIPRGNEIRLKGFGDSPAVVKKRGGRNKSTKLDEDCNNENGTEQEITEHERNTISQYVKSTFPDITVRVVNKKVRKFYIETYTKVCSLHNDTHSAATVNFELSSLGLFQRCWKDDSVRQVVDFDKLPVQIQQFFRVNETPEKQVSSNFNHVIDKMTAFKGILLEPIGKSSEVKKMNLTPSNEMVTGFGDWTCTLPLNRYCPVCKVTHDQPQNFVRVTPTGKGIGCNLRNGVFYPDPVANVSLATVNVLFNTVVNNYGFDSPTNINLATLFPVVEVVFPEDQTLNTLIFASLKGFDTDIAEVFKHLGKSKFGVSWVSDSWWGFMEKEGRWLNSNRIAEDFLRKTVADKYKYLQKFYDSRSKDEKLNAQRNFTLDGIIKRLLGREQTTILHQAATSYTLEDRNFENRLDANKDLLGFVGGVFDLAQHVYRPAESTDYVTLSTGYALPDKVDEHVREEIMRFITSIMPNEEQVRYLLMWLASCLDGHNREEIFTVAIGIGRNGKGVLRDLMKFTLGEYAHDIQASMLTAERPSSSSPCPDLLHIKGKRFVAASEPEKGATINAGFLKFFTGNDPITGRFCHSNDNLEFYPQHSTFLLCNSLPFLDSSDNGAWTRSRILEFKYTFKKTPVAENERPIDDELKRRVKNWGPQFMLLLLEYYKIYRKEGLIPTPDVIAHTAEKRRDNDVVQNWIEENIERTENGAISRADIWKKFQTSRVNPRLLQKEFFIVLHSFFGVPASQQRLLTNCMGWYGYQWVA